MRKTCLDLIWELAQRDPRVVYIGSDLGPGTLEEMKRAMPDRFFMEGVSEAHIVGMAAGLAMDGYIPYVHTISTFITRRCFEQVAVDACLHNLPIRLIGNGGGLVYAPLGPTHLAIEDVGIMRTLPNMAIVAPADAVEMRHFMPSTLDHPSPIYIRLGKGGDQVITPLDAGFTFGKAVQYAAPAKVTVLSTGVMTARAMSAAKSLAAEFGEIGMIHLPTLKPIDEAAILDAARRSELLVTVEEHVRTGGLGDIVASLMVEHLDRLPRLLRLSLPDEFPRNYGSQDTLLEHYGLSPQGIAKRIAEAAQRLGARGPAALQPA